ncbi:MAG: ornithine carbamoyltransferase [Pseudomonadota bacterium]
MPHFLDIHTTPAEELRGMLDEAHRMKAARSGQPKGAPDTEQALANHVVALVFEKPSTRTRTSFDVGVRQLGGETLLLSGAEIHLGHGETIADTARVLSRYVDLIMIRTFDHADLLELADHATVPVINGLTNASHPCQIMADIMTYEEHRGPINGRKVVWLGDGNNVFASFAHAAARFDFPLTFAGPQALDPDPNGLSAMRAEGAHIEIERDPVAAVRDADLVVTDTWLSMHDAPEAREQRHALLHPYQVNDALMTHAAPDALFMHCLPAHRDEEATSAVMDGPHSVIFDEAENRLHAQKAILRWCLNV